MPFAQSSELPPPIAINESGFERFGESTARLDHERVGVVAELVKSAATSIPAGLEQPGLASRGRPHDPRSATRSVRLNRARVRAGRGVRWLPAEDDARARLEVEGNHVQ